MLFLNSHGVGYTVKQSINPDNILSEDKTILATEVTVVDNNGTSVVTALVMALVVATAAVATATTVIVGSILMVVTTATPLLPVVVWSNSKMATTMRKMTVGR